MKILYIVSSNSWGGANIALYNLIYELQSKHEILVVFPCKGSIFQSKLDDLGVQHIALEYHINVYPKIWNPYKWGKLFITTLINNYQARKDIKQIIKEFEPDIVHNNVGPIDISLDACKELGIPHVWHLREYQDLDFNMTFIPSKNYFKRKILQQGNYNIAITKEVFNHWSLRENTDRVIYDGVFDKIRSGKQPIQKGDYFLFVGRVQEGKGTLGAIKAFTIFNKHRNNYRLLIAGKYWLSGKYFKECQKYIRQNKLEDKIEFLGERNDIFPLMQQAIALLVPSYFEGFGFITAEAMLNYCPVIGRNTGGTKEQFDNGLRLTGHEIGFRFNTINEMAIQMEKVTITDTTEIQRYAYQVVTENYTQQIHAKHIEDYYHWILRI